MIENRVIGGKVCHLFEKGDFGPVILWGMFPHKGNEVAHLIECLEDIMCDQSYTVVAYQVEDWNGEFSPWQAPAVPVLYGSRDGMIMQQFIASKGV